MLENSDVTQRMMGSFVLEAFLELWMSPRHTCIEIFRCSSESCVVRYNARSLIWSKKRAEGAIQGVVKCDDGRFLPRLFFSSVICLNSNKG